MPELTWLLAQAVTRLSASGVPSPQVDAEMLMSHVLGIRRGQVIIKAHLDYQLSDAEVAQFEGLVSRREKREPLQHLTGFAPFMSFEVAVGPGVFVPRPETESLANTAVEEAHSMAVGQNGLRVLDLCSGSGVLAITIATMVPHASVVAVEVSKPALDYLRRNVEALAPEVEVIAASVEDYAAQIPPSSVDMIVANPPYIPEGEIPNDREVVEFDPSEALYGGPDGLDVVRDIIDLSLGALRPGGVLMMEHSNLQGEQIRNALMAAGFRFVATERDLVNRERFTRGTRA
jgi:release factor glutamine methyltransferase